MRRSLTLSFKLPFRSLYLRFAVASQSISIGGSTSDTLELTRKRRFVKDYIK